MKNYLIPFIILLFPLAAYPSFSQETEPENYVLRWNPETDSQYEYTLTVEYMVDGNISSRMEDFTLSASPDSVTMGDPEGILDVAMTAVVMTAVVMTAVAITAVVITAVVITAVAMTAVAITSICVVHFSPFLFIIFFNNSSRIFLI